MRRLLLVVLLAGLSLVELGAGTKFVSTWRDPESGSFVMAGQKVATFVMNPEESMRLGPEETLATELRKRGVDCIAGYTVLPKELIGDREKAREILTSAGITGAILVRVIDMSDETSYIPPTVRYTAGYYPTFWGYWDWGWGTVLEPGYLKTDTILSVETLIYNVQKDKLVWGGQSNTTNPKDVRKFVKDLVNAAGKEIRKAGLVEKK